MVHRLRLLALVLGSTAVASCATAPARSHGPNPDADDYGALRTLVVMLDGVPYAVIDSLWREGRFRGFLPPSRVVSPFPSLTQVAFGSIWREAPTPGYEDLYFDPRENRLAGGVLDHMFDPPGQAGFQRHVEVKANPILAGLAYLAPGPASRRELRTIRREVMRRGEHDTTVVAYVVSTDALAHRSSRVELARFLEEVDGMLADVRAHFAPELRIVLFSDHGNEMVPTRRVPLERALGAIGFRIAPRIEGARDVVIPRFGLVGSAFLYAMPSAEPVIADALVGVRGVDLVLFTDGLGRIHVWGRRGRAIVEADPGAARLRYTPLNGDPLFLAATLDSLRREGRLDGDGFAPDSSWLQASLGTPYIDGLRRVVTGMRDRVLNPASVVVSFEPGYHFGSRVADTFVHVTGTHGSLRTGSAMAFFMSTHARAPMLLRSDDLLRYLPGPIR